MRAGRAVPDPNDGGAPGDSPSERGPAGPRRNVRRTLVIIALLVVVAIAGFVPLPYAGLAPGSALAVEEIADLDGAVPGDVNGDLLLTTVSLRRQLTALELAQAWLDDAVTVQESGEVTPPDVDVEEFRRAQRRLFVEAADVAAAVGMRAAGLEVEVTGSGAQVVTVLPDTPAAAALQPGDVLVGADGLPVDLASDLVNLVAERQVGDEVHLEVRRDGERSEIPVELVELSESRRPGLGIAITTVDLDIVLPVDFTIDQGQIGGPSAGLMVALTVYELTNDTDLLRGRTVAGTGTISFDGVVGPIGGIEQKVVAARRAGAELFLAPQEHLDEAREAAQGDLEVVGVRSFEDAVAALRV